MEAANDGQNQDIKGQFVSKNVYCNVNSLVEYCLNKGYEDSDSPVNLDAIENYYTFREFNGQVASFDGGTNESRQYEIDRLQELLSESEGMGERSPGVVLGKGKISRTKYEEILQNEIEELESLESEPAEIFEWWAVSEFLYRKLRELGSCVVDTGSCYVYGRQCSGQAILLDYNISVICADMGILEGQEYSWAK